MTKHYTHCRFPTFPTTLAIKAAAAAQQEADDAIKAKKEAKEVAAGAGADAFATIATKAVVLDAASQGMVDRVTDPAAKAFMVSLYQIAEDFEGKAKTAEQKAGDVKLGKKTAIKMYKQQVKELEKEVAQIKRGADQATQEAAAVAPDDKAAQAVAARSAMPTDETEDKRLGVKQAHTAGTATNDFTPGNRGRQDGNSLAADDEEQASNDTGSDSDSAATSGGRERRVSAGVAAVPAPKAGLDAASQAMADRITDPAAKAFMVALCQIAEDFEGRTTIAEQQAAAEEAKKKTAIKMYKQQVRELETAVVQAKEEAEQAAKANRAAEHASREEEQAQAKRGEELVKKEADQQAKQEEQDVEHADATRQSILILSAATHGEHASSAAAKLNAAFVEHVAVYLARPDVHDLSACALDYLRFAPGAFHKH